MSQIVPYTRPRFRHSLRSLYHKINDAVSLYYIVVVFLGGLGAVFVVAEQYNAALAVLIEDATADLQQAEYITVEVQRPVIGLPSVAHVVNEGGQKMKCNLTEVNGTWEASYCLEE